MFRNGLEPAHLLVLVLAFALVFGWKRLPDMARSLGRSARIFKSEVDQMRGDQTAAPTALDGESLSDTGTPVAGPLDDRTAQLADAERRATEAEQHAAQARADLDRLSRPGL